MFYGARQYIRNTATAERMHSMDIAREQSEEEFERPEDRFRDWVTADGSSGFPAEAGRYHLYVSLACPWAHRTIIVRQLKGLGDAVGMTVVDPVRDETGWRFGDGRDGLEPDPVNGFRYLSEAYRASDPAFANRVTVPVLWDSAAGRIVNNSEDDIALMFNSAFGGLARTEADLYPEALRDAIDAANRRIYEDVNNGVYRAGFAGSQQVYESRVRRLFAALDELEQRLAGQRYLVGDRITLADWQLFCTLVRFDAVYYVHFKCNLRRLVDYPNLWGYLRDLYQQPGIAATVNFDHIKRHYYMTHPEINPTRFVPVGPLDLDLSSPHGRG